MIKVTALYALAWACFTGSLLVHWWPVWLLLSLLGLSFAIRGSERLIALKDDR